MRFIASRFTAKYRSSFYCFLGCFLTLSAAALAEESTTIATQPGGEQITLALENADIKELIRWAAEHINKNIILHPDVKGQVTVISGAPLTREEAYAVFLSTLRIYGYAVINSDNALQVVPAEVANQNGAPLLGNSDAARSGEDVVVQIVKVNNISAQQLATLLKPMLPSSALLTPYPDSNMLLISARAQQIEKLRPIIARLDQGGGTDIDMLTLEFARAKDVVQIVNTLLNKNAGQTTSTNFTLTVDERSNSVLMSGDPIVRQQVRGLIERLDKPKSGEGNTQVIFVRFAAAETLAPILQGVASSFLKSDKDQASANIDLKIEVSKENNALIVTAPPAVQDILKSVIRELDVRRPQVIVEAVIVEVNDDVLNNLGVQWNTDTPNDGVFAGSRTMPDGTVLGVDGASIGAGLTLGFYHSGNLRGLIRALKSNTAANLLSTPTIVALDNESAQILVGSNVPFITGQSTSAASSTATPFQTIERKDIGITLKVKPRINDDSSITMDVDQTVESIAPSNAKAADLVTNKRNITTRVLIENDQVLVLGGLIQNDVTDAQAKVPVLGDMPVVGRLFRSTNTEITKKNLMIFIHPRILATNQDARALSIERYEGIRNKQQKINRQIDRVFIPEAAPLLPAHSGNAAPFVGDPARAAVDQPAPAEQPQ
jgi:general secretion pathway protein D